MISSADADDQLEAALAAIMAGQDPFPLDQPLPAPPQAYLPPVCIKSLYSDLALKFSHL